MAYGHGHSFKTALHLADAVHEYGNNVGSKSAGVQQTRPFRRPPPLRTMDTGHGPHQLCRGNLLATAVPYVQRANLKRSRATGLSNGTNTPSTETALHKRITRNTSQCSPHARSQCLSPYVLACPSSGHEFTLAIVLASHIHELRKSLSYLHTVGTNRAIVTAGRSSFLIRSRCIRTVTSLGWLRDPESRSPTVHDHAGLIAVAHHHSAVSFPTVLKCRLYASRPWGWVPSRYQTLIITNRPNHRTNDRKLVHGVYGRYDALHNGLHPRSTSFPDF
jgi:hypothetical protein